MEEETVTTLQFQYPNAKGNIEKKEVNPYYLAFDNTEKNPEWRWMLNGHDVKRNATKDWELSKITDFEVVVVAPGDEKLIEVLNEKLKQLHKQVAAVK